MARIDFIRHGQPAVHEHDDARRPLTPLGVAQAEHLATVLAATPYTAVYASPLRRAVQTVTPLAAQLGLPVSQDSRLSERRMPGWLADFQGYAQRQWADFDFAAPGGETLRETQARYRAFAAALAPSAVVAAGAHGTAMATLLEAAWPGHGAAFWAALPDAAMLRVVTQGQRLVAAVLPQALGPLGRRVSVSVDRPLGSTHPRWPALRYPVNYGYVAGTLGGDGQPQDAYVLGPKRPLERYCGRVQAVICRHDDREAKWVVAARPLTPAAVIAAVAFQERYFDTTVICYQGSDLDNF
ncbi:histidine phosphatase family protein [Lacticaseibacillus parakribbianus]|uniref:histidine phosphatase family protein n=1 Tax=Lacticaseibacillus parakribbianus TaxID=2970927 RepID=UPI0021CB5F92|nr:histidine phosphatase family protein [Lacticaseibacillus parakribbianus]